MKWLPVAMAASQRDSHHKERVLPKQSRIVLTITPASLEVDSFSVEPVDGFSPRQQLIMRPRGRAAFKLCLDLHQEKLWENVGFCDFEPWVVVIVIDSQQIQSDAGAWEQRQYSLSWSPLGSGVYCILLRVGVTQGSYKAVLISISAWAHISIICIAGRCSALGCGSQCLRPCTLGESSPLQLAAPQNLGTVGCEKVTYLVLTKAS